MAVQRMQRRYSPSLLNMNKMVISRKMLKRNSLSSQSKEDDLKEQTAPPEKMQRRNAFSPTSGEAQLLRNIATQGTMNRRNAFSSSSIEADMIRLFSETYLKDLDDGEHSETDDDNIDDETRSIQAARTA